MARAEGTASLKKKKPSGSQLRKRRYKTQSRERVPRVNERRKKGRIERERGDEVHCRKEESRLAEERRQDDRRCIEECRRRFNN